MANNYNDLTKDLMGEVVRGVRPDQVRARAYEIKQQLTIEYVNSMRALTLVDQIVLNHAPDSEWELGLIRELVPWPIQPVPTTPNAPSQRPISQPDKRDRIIAIAREFVEKDYKVIKASEIAERLAQEGFSGSLRNLSTAAGNVLARRDEWIILRPGEYMYREREEEGSAAS